MAGSSDEPRRRRGGQELPDSVQDRPEQNAGYDEAVRGGTPLPSEHERLLDDVVPASPEDEAALERRDIDERESQGAAADVRRRDRSARGQLD